MSFDIFPMYWLDGKRKKPCYIYLSYRNYYYVFLFTFSDHITRKDCGLIILCGII